MLCLIKKVKLGAYVMQRSACGAHLRLLGPWARGGLLLRPGVRPGPVPRFDPRYSITAECMTAMEAKEFAEESTWKVQWHGRGSNPQPYGNEPKPLTTVPSVPPNTKYDL